jgi:ethanolamine utilization protein EutP (predicted NTPase)
MTEAPAALVARAVKLLDATRRATDAYGRPDLTDRLDHARDRLVAPDINALVVGEFKQGKSTLVNAVLNVPLCPVSDDVATVVPTYLRHGDRPAAEIVAGPVGGNGEAPIAESQRRPIGLDEIPAWASERGNPENNRSIRAVEVRVPRQLLASGLALVDTPGVGGLHSVYGAATMAALGTAEVVLFVSDASQELSGMEIEVLRSAAAACPTVVCVVTKTDLYPAWRRITELDRQRLADAGLGQVPVIAVSSLLRTEALARSSRQLNEESGYPELLRYLNESVIGRAQQVSVRAAISSVVFVLDQLEVTFSAERSVLADPARTQAVADELERARDRFEQLKALSARWQQTLGDGSQDLASEIDHDLRGRLRHANSAAEEAIDAHDPADIWDDFAAWFRHQVATHVAAHTDELRRAAAALAARVAEHFALDEEAIVHDVDVGAVPTIGASLDFQLERTPRGSTMLAAMRGSYGGVLMFGMVGQLAGLALVNPLTAVIGVGLGRRALKEERRRQLMVRRQQAKQAVRRYLDDVSFAVGKQSRDAIRRAQRELRDEFTSRAQQLQRSTKEALSAAESAARRTATERSKRLKDIDAELARLASVRAAADELGAASAAPATSGTGETP